MWTKYVNVRFWYVSWQIESILETVNLEREKRQAGKLNSYFDIFFYYSLFLCVIHALSWPQREQQRQWKNTLTWRAFQGEKLKLQLLDFLFSIWSLIIFDIKNSTSIHNIGIVPFALQSILSSYICKLMRENYKSWKLFFLNSVAD